MNFETNRLNTFANWPASAPVDPIRIAKAGFYYTGEGTEVQCFSCGGKISQWNYGDQVMWRHRHLEPNCEFVVNPRLSGNIPLVLGTECPSNVDSSTSWSGHDDGQNESADTSQDYGLTEDDVMYQSDALRLLSFINWNDTSVSREALVTAGFYHAGEGKLRCAWCGGELAPFRRFGSLGPPLEVHRMYFPRCAHALSLETTQRNNSISPPSSPSPPVQSSIETNDNQRQSSGAAHNARLLESGRTWRALGVVSGGARHPAHASLAARLATFERWPVDRQQAPQVLAEAGFFYTGTDDQVRCFYCDGGLGKWEAGDTPWSEHAHWFPHCGYVLLVKGQEFVDECRGKNSVQRTFSADSGLSTRRRNPGVNFPITESQVRGGPRAEGQVAVSEPPSLRLAGGVGQQAEAAGVEECMESAAALAALGAGLDAARVRRALARRLRATGKACRLQVEECMESAAALAALGAGLDAARVRRALARRLRATGKACRLQVEECMESAAALAALGAGLDAARVRRALPRRLRATGKACRLQVEECMESAAALAALGAGLDAARVRRALARRLRATGKACRLQVEECMESAAALAALGAGLDAARVRRALARRLRATGKACRLQVEECMESAAALAALGAGLDAARVRRALARRLRATGKACRLQVEECMESAAALAALGAGLDAARVRRALPRRLRATGKACRLQVEECMESAAALAALGAGLDAARVRRALPRRLRATGKACRLQVEECMESAAALAALGAGLDAARVRRALPRRLRATGKACRLQVEECMESAAALAALGAGLDAARVRRALPRRLRATGKACRLQVEECMESAAALAALGAGLDAARVRRALARRLRATGKACRLQVEECMESAAALAALGAGLDAARVRRALSRRLRATGKACRLQVEECMESAAALAALGAGLDAARVRRALPRRLRATGKACRLQVEECMESAAALAALGAGLDAARVRRALPRRLRATGSPFTSSEALIDAVLDEQLNEEAWSVSPQSQRLARDILAETLREFAPEGGIIPSQWDDRPESQRSQSTTPPRSPSPEPVLVRLPVRVIREERDRNTREERERVTEENARNIVLAIAEKCEGGSKEESPVTEEKAMSLEEENRQLKEARLCKVCMDSEVSVVFLPCGHLVSCARCGAALAACPLCRCGVKALVRAYLA